MAALQAKMPTTLVNIGSVTPPELDSRTTEIVGVACNAEQSGLSTPEEQIAARQSGKSAARRAR
jgi:hypothetical protein